MEEIPNLSNQSLEESKSHLIDFVTKINKKTKDNLRAVEANPNYPYLLHGSANPSIPEFIPRINTDRMGSEEDKKIKRVHVADTLIGCIIGMEELISFLQKGVKKENYSKDYKGGWFIYRIPYHYALIPNEKLLFDAPYSNEHWLVELGKIKEYKGEVISTVIAESIKIENTGNDVSPWLVSLLIEVKDDTGILLMKNKRLRKGYYRVTFPWSTFVNVRVKWDDVEKIKVYSIKEKDYKKKKEQLAPKLNLPRTLGKFLA